MYLKVDTIHDIYYEEYGNPSGIKILFIHGGPGLGCSEKDKTFFDPETHHVIFYDQRGCGRSKPTGGISNNTTQHLLEDVKLLLDHLQIETAHIFAGSWGSTLAVLFAAKFPKRVSSLILRGFFSTKEETTDIFIRGKIRETRPELWDNVKSLVPEEYQNQVAEYYYKKVSSEGPESMKFDHEWTRYGLSLSRKQISEEEVDQIMSNHIDSRIQIKIQLHYALNGFFVEKSIVYEQAKLIKAQVVIIHGAHDHLCPLDDAKKLHECLKDSNLIIVDAGHSAHEDGVKSELLKCVGEL